MKELTTEEKENLEHFSKLLFCDRKLALIMGLDVDEFKTKMLLEDGEIFKIVSKGRLTAEAEIRESILDMAKRGSTPAQNSAEELLKQLKVDNVR